MIRVFISGHRGMVGSALVREIKDKFKEYELVLADREKLDLTNQNLVKNLFRMKSQI